VRRCWNWRAQSEDVSGFRRVGETRAGIVWLKRAQNGARNRARTTALPRLKGVILLITIMSANGWKVSLGDVRLRRASRGDEVNGSKKCKHGKNQ